MSVFIKDYQLKTKQSQVTFIDVTEKVKEAVRESEITNGICVVSTSHTTCSVFLEEFTHDVDQNGTELLLLDLDDSLQKIVPDHTSAEVYRYPGEEHYQEVESWPDAEKWLPGGDRSQLWNGDAHIKSTIIGASETFSIQDKKLAVGVTGYVYFADFDKTRERTRELRVTLIGE